ncbi:MAG: type IV pilus secretin PilQ [Gammaproteobacteria bacterium]
MIQESKMVNTFKTPIGAPRHTRISIRTAGMNILMGLFLIHGAATAADTRPAPSTSMNAVSFSSLPGNQVQIKFALSSPVTQPLSFSTDNPARIAFDFPDTANKISPKNQPVGLGMVKSINTVEVNGRTRAVLNLVKMAPYETRTEGSNFYVTLKEDNANPAMANAAQGATGATSSAPAHDISKIDFQRGPKGEGRVIANLSDPATVVDVRKEGGKIIVDFSNTRLPPNLEQRLDVTDFATPVQNIETSAQGRNVRMVISAAGNYDHIAYQADTRFTIEVKGISKEEQDIKEKQQPTYKGERLSLNFQNIEVRAVLQIIADFTKLNMVTSDTVTGNLTLRLQNVPWDQALDIVLKSKGLAMRQTGNVILVAPSEEVSAREKQELESKKQIEELEPLRSELIQINYAKAADLANILKSKENSLLTKDRGNVTIDERTNALLVQDVADKLAEIRRLLVKLDVPIRQVLIEARVVIANDTFSKDLGVRFGASGVKANGNNGVITTSGSAAGTDTVVSSALGNLQSSGQPFPVGMPSLPNRLNVNFPVLNPSAGRLALAILGSDYLLDLELSAMQAEGRGEVVSSPRVITADRKEATIKQGTQIAYIRPGGIGGTSTVEFKDALLSLKVKPQITPDNHIIMDLLVTKDTVGQILNGVPSIDKKEVSTQVLIANGETVVLGGVYETVRSKKVTGIPFLSELPGIGYLFRNTGNVDDKVELLIFVTPKVVNDAVSVR